jgi:hypothetical protein
VSSIFPSVSFLSVLSFLLISPVPASAGELDGAWKQGCGPGIIKEEKFSGETAEYTETNFWEPTCKNAVVQTISRGKINLGEAVREPQGALSIDFTFSSVHMRPLYERTVEIYNKRHVCGISDWALNEEREVTGRECDFFGLGSVMRIPAAGEKRFGIVKVTEGALYFGRLTPEKNGLTPEARPVQLDPAPYRAVK